MQYLAAKEIEVWQTGMRIESALIVSIYHLEKSDYWSLILSPETQVHINANGVLHLQDK